MLKILKTKATELDWFLFETRIRQIIQELTTPLQGTTKRYAA